MTMKGGNTDEVYKDGRLEFAESLQKQHPDVASVTTKFGRYHHQVNFNQFKKTKLIRKKNLSIPDRINEYGMVLKKINEK